MVTDVNSRFYYYRNSPDHSIYSFEGSMVLHISASFPRAARKVARNHGAIIVENLGDLKRKATQLSEEKSLQDTSVKEGRRRRGTHGVQGSRLPVCISLVKSEGADKNLNESTNAEMAAARKDVWLWLTLLWFHWQVLEAWALLAMKRMYSTGILISILKKLRHSFIFKTKAPCFGSQDPVIVGEVSPTNIRQ